MSGGRLWTLGALATLTALVIGRPALAAGGETYRLVGVDAAQRMLADGGVRVYDVNPRDVYDEHHLPGSIHVGGGNLEAMLPADRSARILFYCAGPK